MSSALSLKGIKKTYANGHIALDGVDIEVKRGDFFALLGPNGAGKSTMIGIISSLVNKTEGSVSIFGHDLDKEPASAKRQLGLVPQEININPFEKVEDIIITQAGYYGIPAKQAKEKAHYYLDKLALMDKLSTPARMLSGGMKRRLMVARALIHQPKLLILDEPTAGVDIEIRRTLWKFIQEVNEQGTTILLTTHYLEEAEQLCRTIAIIDKGKIIKNTPMKALLGELQKEKIILHLESELQSPQIDLNGYTTQYIDGTTLEVDVPKEQGLNSLFSQLEAKGIKVTSMRNKENRLEALFVNLTNL